MSHHEHKTCFGKAASQGSIVVPNSSVPGTPWKFYNHLIGRIPEDIRVLDCCVGTNWSYVEAECGTGVSYTLTGGGRPVYSGSLNGLPLRDVAELSKSWNFREATLGVAALNAWYSQPDKVLALGGHIDESGKDDKSESALTDTSTPAEEAEVAIQDEASTSADEAEEAAQNKLRPFDPFASLRSAYAGKKVTVIGHFPGVGKMAELCDLTVLERNPRGGIDTPDPACEYVLPSQDFVFSTGVTIINKTAPRIFDLSQNATLVLVGPSVIPSEFLFSWGVDILAGRVVLDPEKIKVGVKQGASFDGALRMYTLEKS